MDPSVAVMPAGPPLYARPLARLHFFLMVIALLSWWEVSFRQSAILAAGQRANLAAAATVMLAARLVASALEAAFYALWWRTRGARLPYARFLVALVALSLVDRLSLGLAALAGRTPALAAWLAPVAGLHLVKERWPGLEPGLLAAFGSLGLLTLARLVMTAWLQSAGLGCRLRGPLLVTALAWSATRVALWWATDLFRGMSPLR